MKKERINRVGVSTQEAIDFEALKAGARTVTKKIIFSFFPVDKWDCPCQIDIRDLKNRFSTMTPKQAQDFKFKMEYFTCPQVKTDMKKFKMICNNCDEQVAQVYATDAKMTNWCDLHYMAWHDGYFWQGALAVNNSPIDGKIGIECACGVDTRDFRANTTLKGRQLLKQIAKTKVGRLFGQEDSKFKLVPSIDN